MQCPRCGLQNGRDATRCLRCSQPFETAPGHSPGHTSGRPPGTAPAPSPGHDPESTSGSPTGRAAMPAQWRNRTRGDGSYAGTQAQPPGRAPTRDTGWQYPGYTPKPPPPPPPPPEPAYGSVWRILAAVALPIAGLACLAYGGWAMVARRGIFADLAAGRSVTAEAARDSDRLDELLLWLAVGALVVAVALWVVAHLRRRKPFGTAGFTAAVLLVTGAVVLVGGAYLTSLVNGEVSNADTAATGFLIMGGGSMLLGAGAFGALVAVFVKPPRPEVPSAGFAGWGG
jgi:hypothetical protein